MEPNIKSQLWADQPSDTGRIAKWVEGLFLVRLVTFAVVSSYQQNAYIPYVCDCLNTAAAAVLVTMISWRLIVVHPNVWRCQHYLALKVRSCRDLDNVKRWNRVLCQRVRNQAVSIWGSAQGLHLRIRRRIGTSGGGLDKDPSMLDEYLPSLNSSSPGSEQEALLRPPAAPRSLEMERMYGEVRRAVVSPCGYDRDDKDS
jgi:hypothetical protein